MEALRTPEERFDRLPGFPWEPRYREWEGLRLAYVDEGEGAPVVLLHGEPTWSFLWRKVVARLLESGHRCIADLPGSAARTSRSTTSGTPTPATPTRWRRCSSISTCSR